MREGRQREKSREERVDERLELRAKKKTEMKQLLRGKEIDPFQELSV